MKITSVAISKVDSVSLIKINGEKLENVLDYKITSSAYGSTVLELKVDLSDSITEVESFVGQTK